MEKSPGAHKQDLQHIELTYAEWISYKLKSFDMEVEKDIDKLISDVTKAIEYKIIESGKNQC